MVESTIKGTPGGAMLECALAVNRMCEHLGHVYDVSARDVFAIVELIIHGPCSATELADRLYVTRGAMTSLMRRLSEAGWIETAADPLDGRRVVISATERPVRLLAWWAERFSARVIGEQPEAVRPVMAGVIAECVKAIELYRSRLRAMGPAEVRALAALE